MAITYSNHADARMQQRGLRKTDISLVINTGTFLGDDSIILLNRDVDREIKKRKREIERLEKLRSVRVVLGRNDTVITAYKSEKRVEKSLLRGKHYFKPRINNK